MYKIEKGIPKPPAGRKRIYPLYDMDIGDSFFVPRNGKPLDVVMRKMSATISVAQRKSGRVFSCRMVPDEGRKQGGVRVWRDAPKLELVAAE